jgi:hypothetical protein
MTSRAFTLLLEIVWWWSRHSGCSENQQQFFCKQFRFASNFAVVEPRGGLLFLNLSILAVRISYLSN